MSGFCPPLSGKFKRIYKCTQGIYSVQKGKFSVFRAILSKIYIAHLTVNLMKPQKKHSYILLFFMDQKPYISKIIARRQEPCACRYINALLHLEIIEGVLYYSFRQK